MDSENSSIADSSNGKISKLASFKRDLFLSTCCCNQEWSLPDSLIYYIVKNPSTSKCYAKLIQACKYFFIKNPILVIKLLSRWFEGHECRIFLDYGNHVDLRNISSKLWIVNDIVIQSDFESQDVQYFSSTVLPKIYKSDIQSIALKFQNIILDDLIWLASKCKHVHFSAVTVKNDDRSVATLEKLFNAFPNVKRFWYNFQNTDPNIIKSDTVKEMVKIPHFHFLYKLELFDVPESFNLDDFYSYIKTNKQTTIRLRFYDSFLSDPYKQRLQEIVNETLKLKNMIILYHIFFILVLNVLL